METIFTKFFPDEQILFKLAYNPTHLQGIGDMISSFEQSQEDRGILSDTDLITILNAIHDTVHTQKMVLIGHSQGSFYTNSIYEYLTTHGIPQDAVAVYNTGTPASFVAGGGDYTTSATDKVINKVREGIAATGGKAPLPANVLFTLDTTQQKDAFGGHSFVDVYLRQGDFRIAQGLNTALNTLKSGPVPIDVTDGCFNPPGVSIPHVAEKVALRVGDITLSTGTHIGKYVIDATVASLKLNATIGIGPVHINIISVPNESPEVSQQQQIREDTPTPPTKNETTTASNTPASHPIVPAPVAVDTTAHDLAQLQARLNEASALIAFLQLQVTALAEAREKECITHSLQGPWNHVGWVGDQPGCDDETPWIQKMFWAPIQGAGGEVGGSTTTTGCASTPLGCVPDFTPDTGPIF